MRIALIGGSGFVGTALVARLRPAHTTWVIDVNPPACEVEYRSADVRDGSALSQAVRGADVILNLAAEHRDDVRPLRRYREVNVDGARHTCEAAEANGITSIVFTSTVAVYGLSSGISREDSQLRPYDEYGRTKAKAERIFEDWLKRGHDRRLIVVRPSVIFGQGSRGNVTTLIDQIGGGRFAMVGDGQNRKSMAFVSNVAAFLEHTLQLHTGYHLFNYADMPDMTTRELVDFICEVLDKSPPKRSVPCWLAMAVASLYDFAAWTLRRPRVISRSRVRKFCAETRLAGDRAAATGFQPEMTLLEALRDTVLQRLGPRSVVDQG